jgi:hypothetical protein
MNKTLEFDVLRAVLKMLQVCLNIVSCQLVKSCQHFIGDYYLHFQSLAVQKNYLGLLDSITTYQST